MVGWDIKEDVQLVIYMIKSFFISLHTFYSTLVLLHYHYLKNAAEGNTDAGRCCGWRLLGANAFHPPHNLPATALFKRIFVYATAAKGRTTCGIIYKQEHCGENLKIVWFLKEIRYKLSPSSLL